MLTERQLFLRYLGQTSGNPLMLEIDRAEGVWLYSPNGERYLDLISGVSVSNTGHHNQQVVDAIKEQADRFLHLMVYGELVQSPQVRYAELLSSVLPAGLETIYFVNSGSEAVEGALKLAKKITGRTRIVSFRNAYHGSTHGALSIQGAETWKNPFRPLLPDCFIAEFNSPDAFNLIDERTACVIIEPVQGEAGIIVPEKDFLNKLRVHCDKSGALLIFDEVQTAFGRLGAITASEKYSVTPDIIVLGKALGGGLPLGAFVSSTRIMNALASDPPLGHITTFGGHPLSCAAGMASLDYLVREKLAESAENKGMLFRKFLDHSLISEIRGEGLMLAVVPARGISVPALVTRAPAFGILIDYFLFCSDAFRIAPPLTISEQEIESACNSIIKLLEDSVK